jgi:hypothetical protein
LIVDQVINGDVLFASVGLSLPDERRLSVGYMDTWLCGPRFFFFPKYKQFDTPTHPLKYEAGAASRPARSDKEKLLWLSWASHEVLSRRIIAKIEDRDGDN